MRKQVMTRAWNLYRSNTNVKTFADALRKAWAEYKATKAEVAETLKKASVKDWFDGVLAEKFNLPRIYSLSIFAACKETEKAVYAIFSTGFNAEGTKAYHRASWIPKAAIENLDNLKRFTSYDEAVEAFEAEYTM